MNGPLAREPMDERDRKTVEYRVLARQESRRSASVGPRPVRAGSIPADAQATTRPSGVSPWVAA